tara:strand:+ start:4717 stop:5370 length:654 start_codon:yes stop_codon:yes gene_type:complete
MKSRKEIQERIDGFKHNPDTPAGVGDWFTNALRWVLEDNNCPLCAHRDRKDLEVQVFNGIITTSYLEAKYNWEAGLVEQHLSKHIDYDPAEAVEVEKARSEAITTLDMANDVFSRITQWLDEWEAKKDAEGIDGEWLSTATRLVAQANTSVKLIGTLKKEIGVDSQILIAQQQVNGVMGILVDVLRNEPKLLNDMQLRLGTMQTPKTVIEDAEWEVL